MMLLPMLNYFPYPLNEILARWRIKHVMKLALPIIGGMSSQTLLNLIDTAMVGRLGAHDVAAVGITSIALWVIVSPLQGFSSSVQTLTARRLGEKAHTRIHEALITGLYLIVLIAFPMAYILRNFIPQIVPFFSGDSAVVHIGIGYMGIRILGIPFVGMNFAFRGFFNGLHKSSVYLQTLLLMHGTNIALNYVLIFGKFGFPRMESKGAALASLIAILLGTCNYLRLLIKHKTPHFRFTPKLITSTLLKNLLSLSIPMSIMGVFLSFGYLVFYRITAILGTAELAATNILVNLMLACFLPALGMGLATISLVSKSLGENDPHSAKIWSYSTLMITETFLSIIGILFILFPQFWIQIFIDDPIVQALAIVPLVILGFMQFFDPLGIIWMHTLMGGGANKQVMKYTILVQWGLFLPGTFLLIQYFSGTLTGLWVLMALYRFILMGTFLRGFLKEKWLSQKI